MRVDAEATAGSVLDDLIAETQRCVGLASVETCADVRSAGRQLAGFSAQLAEEERELKRFLYERLYNVPELVPVRMEAQRVVANLLSNAVKFTGVGGHIEIRCTTIGETVRIDVRDDGPGIPLRLQEEVFKPFVQVHAGLSRTEEGTGLGLAISRALAVGMGGALTVQSEPGAGSTFALVLPAAPAP